MPSTVMASTTPYTYIQCPCVDPTTLTNALSTLPLSPTLSRDEQANDSDEKTFDPRAPRSNYSLFPLEYLLFCEECHQIRCPRCITEEVITYFCPNCLFEVPSSNLKSEGNRCTRSCFQCPICVAPLAVTPLDPSTPGHQPRNPERTSSTWTAVGPYVLACSYCSWSSLDIGIKFDKSSGIYSQLSKLQNGGKPKPPIPGKDHSHRSAYSGVSSSLSGASGTADAADEATASGDTRMDVEAQFAALKMFYKNQLTHATGPPSLRALAELDFSSPGSLSRFRSLYMGGELHKARSKRREEPREACSASEGLQISDLDETEKLRQLAASEWDECSSIAQNTAAVAGGAGAAPSHFSSDLRPTAYLLRSKRSKRCPLCRHILSRPEARVASANFRIKLIAASSVPAITIKPMSAADAGPVLASAQPYTPPEVVLVPGNPAQFLLTFRNPVFEPVSVSLATTQRTTGRFPSCVTLLCPQFQIGASTDLTWDEEFKDSTAALATGKPHVKPSTVGADGPEAGRVFDAGRNWTTIVMEVTPLPVVETQGATGDSAASREDDHVLEIPIFVRVEWETEAGQDDGGVKGLAESPVHESGGRSIGEGGAGTEVGGIIKVKRELAYWCVLGIGRIAGG